MAQPSVSLITGSSLAGEVVALACFKGSAPDGGRLAARLATTVNRLAQRPGWKGMADQVARSTTGGKMPVLVEAHGLGARSSFTGRQLSAWLNRIVEQAGREGTKEMTVILPDQAVARDRHSLRVLCELLNAGYGYDRLKTRKRSSSLRKIYLLPPDGQDENYARALPLARSIGRGVKLARDLGNTPPNEAVPQWMAEQAEVLATRQGIDHQILLPDQIAEMGMGGILAVGGGSAHSPRMVRLEWGDGEDVISFVGKGVTFDTGGISIKPAAAMEEMKYDKCGACTVLGLVRVISELELPGRFRAYLPLVENMPGGRSYRPSDVVRCYNGKTVEILNTDAEGRMILADALAWAAEERPDTLIEMSTLTGATVVALGNQGAALYSPEDALAQELQAAALSSGERLWRMPLWPEFSDEMKGIHADLKNLGSRWGGANSAAAFLGNFVGSVKRWAHLDIAGTAYRGAEDGPPPGATGFGVGLITDWLLRRTDRF